MQVMELEDPLVLDTRIECDRHTYNPVLAIYHPSDSLNFFSNAVSEIWVSFALFCNILLPDKVQRPSNAIEVCRNCLCQFLLKLIRMTIKTLFETIDQVPEYGIIRQGLLDNSFTASVATTVYRIRFSAGISNDN